jgi:uncharacterized membrane protein
MADLSTAMYRVLVAGMLGSSFLYVVGLVLFFIQNSNPAQTNVAAYTNLGQFFTDLYALKAPAILTAATLVLVATPVSRVFISIVVFAKARDLKFVILTLTVFLVLMTSIALGYFGHFSPR